MIFLGIFDFYHIENYGGTSFDLLGIILTAIFSGIVAWFAAWLQYTYSKYQSKIQELSTYKNTFEIIEKNSIKITKTMEEHIKYLKNSFYKNGLHKFFDIPQLAINETAFKYILQNDYSSIFKSLKDLQIEEVESEKFINGYSSIESFLQNVNDIQTFYNQKLLEYNNIVNKAETKLYVVANELNKLIYSKRHLELVDQISKTDITLKALFRKTNPDFEIYQELDKIAAKYNNSKKRFIDTLNWLNEIRLFCNKNSIRLNVIDLAQSVLNARSSYENLKNFYKSFNRTYKSYHSVNKAYLKNAKQIPIISENIPEKINFSKWLHGKKLKIK